jgi:hypothetical protein
MNTWAAVGRVAEDAEFDPTIVTPGVEGFIMTGIFAAAVIVLGIVLVRRLRRNAYRSEAREQIARELEEQGGKTDAAAPGSSSEGAERGPDDSDEGAAPDPRS